jgi:hypothetical protein
VEARRREERDRENLRSAWLAQGGDERVFEREYPRVKAERGAARLRELD